MAEQLVWRAENSADSLQAEAGDFRLLIQKLERAGGARFLLRRHDGALLASGNANSVAAAMRAAESMIGRMLSQVRIPSTG
jgi:hypothetical protein